jgi:hypothetical protein
MPNFRGTFTMKLIFCLKCQSIVTLSQKKVRVCECGQAKAMYIDELNAVFTAEEDRYILIGFANYPLQKVVSEYFQYGSESSLGINFTSFLIPEPCDTFRRVCDKEFKQLSLKLFTDE